MAIQMPKLALPKLALPAVDRKSALMIGGAVVVLGAAGYFGWQNMMSEPPPASKPVAMKAPPKPAAKPAPKPAAPAPAAAAKPAVPPPEQQIAAVEKKEMAAEMKSVKAPMATKAAMAAPRTHTRANEDARECLKQPTDALIAHCAEQYR